MEYIFAFLGIVLVVLIYFIPALQAYQTKHPQKQAILILNLFLGWTTIGWVIALVWAYIKEKKEQNMFCSNCGKEIDNNSKFCQFCGQEFKEKENSTNNENNGNGLLLVSIFGGIVFVIFIMFILNIIFSN